MRLTFVFDRSLLRWAFFWALALGVQGCQSRCSDAFELDEIIFTPAGVACDVTFSNGDRVARYAAPPPASPDGGIASKEGSACNESNNGQRVPCVAVAGPAFANPTSCSRIACELDVGLNGDDGHALADFLKSNSFQLTLTCGGVIVKQESLTFVTQVCPV